MYCPSVPPTAAPARHCPWNRAAATVRLLEASCCCVPRGYLRSTCAGRQGEEALSASAGPAIALACPPLLVVCLLSVSSTFRLLSTTPRRNAARTAALSLVAVSRPRRRSHGRAVPRCRLSRGFCFCLLVCAWIARSCRSSVCATIYCTCCLIVELSPSFICFRLPLAFRSPSAHDFPVLHVNWISFCFLLGGLKTRSKI